MIDYLFAVFAIVWIVLNMPYPGPPMYKLVTAIVGIILILFVLFGLPAYHLR